MLHRAGAARQLDEDLDAVAAGLDEAIRAAADRCELTRLRKSGQLTPVTVSKCETNSVEVTSSSSVSSYDGGPVFSGCV